MTAVLQRSTSASVAVDGDIKGKAGQGMVILVGCSVGDTTEDADMLCEKIAGLRIFTDEDDKMNLTLTSTHLLLSAQTGVCLFAALPQVNKVQCFLLLENQRCLFDRCVDD